MYQAADTRYDGMTYNRCGSSGLRLPAVSLGFWHNFGNTGVYETMRKLCFTAFDNGVTHFDLANNYGPEPGSAEKNLGRIVKENFMPYRDELIISTKAGYEMWNGPYGNWGSRKYLLASLDQSLTRLGLPYVDIFYHHRMDPETPLEETMGALDQAVALGYFLKYTKFNKWINTAVAILLLVAAIALGLNFPVYVDLGTWHIIIFVYILIASVAPVWALLQPRDYLNSYLLIFMIVGAVIGVFVANPACNLKPFTSFNVNGQYMFPILFVTIACGAVSGFHSLVSSGTASKQIKNEKNMLPVSFGAMLMESMLAIIALIAVASFADGEAAAQGLTTQPQIFAGAIANFLSVVGLPHSLVFTLINLAVSAFALTSLDSVARVGRLSFQEFFMDSDTDEENMSPFVKVVTNKYFATIITLVLAYLLTKVGYAEIWPLFGSANQLLSVLALVACAVFLKKTKRQGWMLWVPMLFMMAVTFTALSMTIIKLTNAFMTTGLDLGNTLQLVFAVLLLILGVLVAIQGIKKLLEKADK